MKNLFDKRWQDAISARLDTLTPESRAQWGRMNVGQMVCHLTDPMRIALGELEAKDISTIMTRTLLRWAVLGGMPPPKGKVQTFPEIDQVAGGGTKPEALAADIATLKDVIERFRAHALGGKPIVPSPAFGNLSPRAWGRLQYVHMHYHLKQFGA